MTRKSIAYMAVGLMLMFLAASAEVLPDLKVIDVSTGEPSFINASEAVLPLTVTIKNTGGPTATRFKLSVDVIDSAGKLVKAFRCPGQEDRWYPWKTGLARDAKYTFRGSLYIGKPGGPSLHGQTITLIPRVDSSSGDEFVADYGRVQESDEGNNESRIMVRLR
jgi:hypothetical protein